MIDGTPSTTASSRRILIAEDERHIRSSLSILLRQSGYEVSVAEDGEVALGVICPADGTAGEAVDLLILDLQMPRMTGLQLIDALRKRKIVLPVLAISGYLEPKLTAELMVRGVVNHLAKPFHPGSLLAAVNSIFSFESSTGAGACRGISGGAPCAK